MKNLSLLMLVLMLAVVGCPARTDASDNNTANDVDQVDPALVDEVLDFKTGEWITDYDTAVKYAQNSGLPILINFTGSDWCIWCIRLKDEVFSKKEFKDYAKESLILLELDFPREKSQTPEMKQANAALQNRFKVTGYPTIVLMDGNQKEIARTGYQQGGAAAYVAHLKSLIKK